MEERDLVIDGNKYKRQVSEPTVTDTLTMNPEEIRRILKHKVYSGNEKKMNGSTFIAHASRVHSIQEIVDIYKQMRYRYADTTHVMCAYRILDEDIANSQDAIDGGELGASRKILNMMIDNLYGNCAVYVIRYHNGPNLGPQRFKIIEELAQKAIQAIPAGIHNMPAQSRCTAAEQLLTHEANSKCGVQCNCQTSKQ